MPDPSTMNHDELREHVEREKAAARLLDAKRKLPEIAEPFLHSSSGVPGTGAPMYGGISR